MLGTEGTVEVVGKDTVVKGSSLVSTALGKAIFPSLPDTQSNAMVQGYEWR